MELKFLEYFTLLIGIYMAWNIGANDVANAISTSVGAKALSLKKAIIIAAILEFAGAFLLGGNVSTTIQSNIVDPTIFQKDIYIFIYGIIASLLATAIWLNLASYLKMPVSTTHAIVGSILGFGAIIGGIHAVKWGFILFIFLSWIITPVLSGFISYFIFLLLQRKIFFALSPLEATKKLIPVILFFAFFIFSFIIISSKIVILKIQLSFFLSLVIASLIGALISIISFFLLKRIKITSCPVMYHSPNQLFSLEKAKRHMERTYLSSKGEEKEKTKNILEEVNALIDTHKEKTKYNEQTSEYSQIEKIFGYLQIISLCLIAFAHGSNDVANAIGPIAAVIKTITLQKVNFPNLIPSWILLIGSLGIIFGLVTWGWRVVETIGHKITSLTPSRGFSAELGAATIILIASKLGMPISTTHALVGSILGVGIAKGLSALNLKAVKDIALSWMVTIPICAILSIIIFYILKFILY